MSSPTADLSAARLKESSAGAFGSLVWTSASITTILYAATVFVGAFLLFQVQPIISGCVLPWYGGSPAVWTTCLLFFQTALLGGYLYVHLLTTTVSRRNQPVIHAGLMAIAWLALPIQPTEHWQPIAGTDPAWSLLTLLVAHVGLPYFALATTGPLLQSWWSNRPSGSDNTSVYRLYALSNIASLLALLTYPFFFEPWLQRSTQTQWWQWGFGVFVILQFVLGAIRWFSVGNHKVETTGSTIIFHQINRSELASWFGLPMLASAALLAATSHLCSDIAVIPFLWVLPLSIYLMTFIIAFDSPRWYHRRFFSLLTLMSVVGVIGSAMLPPAWRMPAAGLSTLGLLGGLAMLCHGEAAARKPDPRRLTLFYLCLSAGGAAGGLAVAIIAPLLFDTLFEWTLIAAAAAVLGLAGLAKDRGVPASRCAIGLTAAAIILPAFKSDASITDRSRNFFGVLSIERQDGEIRLLHGRTNHGVQLAGQPHVATSYYTATSGIGRVIAAMQPDGPLRYGVVGLGGGVMAAHTRAGDVIEFAEIDPAVALMAREKFDFLNQSRGRVGVDVTDGRLWLARRADRYDVLAIDAFSGDAIPTHLLTAESMQLYRDRLTDRGVLSIHVTNNHLDLLPLVYRLAGEAGFRCRHVTDDGRSAPTAKPSTWTILASPAHRIWDRLAAGGDADLMTLPASAIASAPRWTDDHSHLASVLRLPWRRPTEAIAGSTQSANQNRASGNQNKAALTDVAD